MGFFLLLFLLLSNFFTSESVASLDDPCLKNATLDVVFVLDTTVSMKLHKSYFRSEIPQLMNEFVTRFPDSRLGVVSYNDEDTTCQPDHEANSNFGARVDLELTNDIVTLRQTLNNWEPVYGDRFLPEDSLGALLVSALGKDVGWNTDTTDKSYRRVVVLVTDAPYRFSGDQARVCSKNLKPNNGDGEYNHSLEDYPTEEQVATALKSMEIFPIFLTLTDKQKNNYQYRYEDFLVEWKIRGTAIAAEDAVDIVNVVANGISEVICAPETTELPTTTTELPTTTVASTIISTTPEVAIPNGPPVPLIIGGAVSAVAIIAIVPLASFYLSHRSKDGVDLFDGNFQESAHDFFPSPSKDQAQMAMELDFA